MLASIEQRVRSGYARRSAACAVLLALVAVSACSEPEFPFDPEHPARGPGQLVGNGAPVSGGNFASATALDPGASGEHVVCDQSCEAYCAQLGPSLTNPVDRGMCRALWGMGLDTQPVEPYEACRRLIVDTLGRFPTRAEVEQTCMSKPWSDVVSELMSRSEFVFVNQRLWADRLLYNNETVNIERIFDADDLVGKLYRGQVAYDEFAAVVSAHPVLTRRYSTPGDRAEAMVSLFLGRPPYENERADLARLYTLWSNGYFDHPRLKMRVPDAFIRHQCIGPNGEVDESTKGQCTSVLWGYNELVLPPDIRASEGETWSGLLRPAEWQALALPGRIVARQLGFWEHAVDLVVQQYLGYDLTGQVPGVRQGLVQYLLDNNGDIRAVHHAVLTSLAYLQSSRSALAPDAVVNAARWSYGPLKQVLVEPWIDSVKASAAYPLADCDHRITRPSNLLDSDSIASVALVQHSRWQLTGNGVDGRYRDLAQTLGGCPDNQAGGRFTAVSILTTAVQETFIANVCNPKQDGKVQSAAIEKLLPEGILARQALDEPVAQAILQHQLGLFLGRPPTSEEAAEATAAAAACAPKPCTAENFARPLCFAVLTSSEQLFY